MVDITSGNSKSDIFNTVNIVNGNTFSITMCISIFNFIQYFQIKKKGYFWIALLLILEVYSIQKSFRKSAVCAVKFIDSIICA